MLAVVISDSIAAVVIGFIFTALLGSVGYIAKNSTDTARILATLKEKVDGQDKTLERHDRVLEQLVRHDSRLQGWRPRTVEDT